MLEVAKEKMLRQGRSSTHNRVVFCRRPIAEDRSVLASVQRQFAPICMSGRGRNGATNQHLLAFLSDT